VDIVGAPSALLLALLAGAQQQVSYASGRVVSVMSSAFTGEGKTDAKDAHVIAETVRLRRDLTVVDHTGPGSGRGAPGGVVASAWCRRAARGPPVRR